MLNNIQKSAKQFLGLRINSEIGYNFYSLDEVPDSKLTILKSI